jgi:hypothetical protein
MTSAEFYELHECGETELTDEIGVQARKAKKLSYALEEPEMRS